MRKRQVNTNTNIAPHKKVPQKTIGIVVVLLAIIGVVWFFVVRGTPAADIAFVEDSIEIIVGNTLKMDYVILPDNTTNKKVTWKSSNISVADVSNTGTITAMGEGTTVITVTTANGKIDECLVTVKPTAFDYLKGLGSSADGYTIGNYLAPSGATISVGICYLSDEDALYIMNKSDGKDPATIAIPSSLSGEYDGYQEWSYSGKTVHTLYSVNASTLTANTEIISYYCDETPWWGTSDFDAVYTAKVQTMLAKLYQEVLEPNGYTYADLGFDSYS